MEWRRIFGGGESAAQATLPALPDRPGLRAAGLPAFLDEIVAFQKLRPDLEPIRVFNHRMVDDLKSLRGLRGSRLLDVGASYRGYALERALHHRASLYVGVSLDIKDEVEVSGPTGTGRLLRMNGETLEFPDGTFDLALTLSTFEHFRDGAAVLGELHRVLRPGGSLFLSFEPVWTSSYGHHLHHLPDVGRLMPPWSHLLWTPDQMRRALGPGWPQGASMTLEEAVHWVYEGDAINRVPLLDLRAQLQGGPFEVEWLVPLPDSRPEARPELAAYLSRILPHSADELLTLGYSALLNKR